MYLGLSSHIPYDTCSQAVWKAGSVNFYALLEMKTDAIIGIVSRPLASGASNLNRSVIEKLTNYRTRCNFSTLSSTLPVDMKVTGRSIARKPLGIRYPIAKVRAAVSI